MQAADGLGTASQERIAAAQEIWFAYPLERWRTASCAEYPLILKEENDPEIHELDLIRCKGPAANSVPTS